MEILYKFINRIGHAHFMHVTIPENRYSIECTTHSIILMSMYCSLPWHKKYFIMNPIIRCFSKIGIVSTNFILVGVGVMTEYISKVFLIWWIWQDKEF